MDRFFQFSISISVCRTMKKRIGSILISFILLCVVVVSDEAQGAEACLDKDIVQLSAPGIPPAPTKSEDYLKLWLDPIPKFLIIKDNEPGYHFFKKTIHNRPIRVFISFSFVPGEDTRINISEFVFNTWSLFWQEFGGFPFDKYTVVFDSNLYWSYSGFGVGMDASFTDYDHIAHEMFHSWNGNAFRANQDEAVWFIEGMAIHYNSQLVNTFYHYQEALEYYHYYKQNYGDRPLSTISINSDADTFGFGAMKGLLVGYLLDYTLSLNGHHLGEVHREIYRRYGTNDSDYYEFSNEDILAIVNEVTGEDFTQFFNDYVFGTKALPLHNGSFEYICHGNPHLLTFYTPTPFIPALLLTE